MSGINKVKQSIVYFIYLSKKKSNINNQQKVGPISNVTYSIKLYKHDMGDSLA